MKVKMILPALTEALSPFWRPIKYHLFPPLGLASIAGFFDESDDIDLQDEHVEPLNLNDQPDLVIIEPIWDILIRLKQVNHLIPVLEQVLMGFTSDESLPENEIIPRFDQV